MKAPGRPTRPGAPAHIHPLTETEQAVKNQPIEIDTPARDHVYAEREANRAAEAAREAATAIAEGRSTDATVALYTAGALIDNAKRYMDGAQ